MDFKITHSSGLGGAIKCLTIIAGLLLGFSAKAQVGVGTTTPDASAQLDVVSTSRGVLIPRLTSGQRSSIAAPATGLVVYQTDNTPGFYFFNNGQWQRLATSSEIGTGGSGNTVVNTLLNGAANPAPSAGNNGDFYINTTTYTLYGPKSNGSWPASGISLVGGGTLPQAITSGGTIKIGNGEKAALAPVTLDLADKAVTSSKIADGAVTNAALDKANIPLSGFGTPLANVSMGGYKVTNLAPPTNNKDAVTKKYVDDAVAAAGANNAPVLSLDAAQNLSIKGGNSVSLADLYQSLSLAGTVLSISGPRDSHVDLAGLLAMAGGGSGAGGLVSHDATLTGNGVSSSPLGVANQAITPNKLTGITGNGNAGQVLTSTGAGGFTWADVTGGSGGSGISGVTAFGGLTATTTAGVASVGLNDGALALQKIAPVPTGTILGNLATGSASPVPLNMTSLKTMLALTSSDVGLGNVKNVDQTNAANLTSGTIPTARFGNATIPAAAIIGNGLSTDYLRGDGTWGPISGASGAASGITVTPNGALTSTNVQAALEELQSEISTAASGGLTAVKHDATLSGDGNATNLGIADNGVGTSKITDKAVTLGKMADLAGGTLLGNSSLSTGKPEAITIGSGLSLSSGVLSAATPTLEGLSNVAVASKANGDMLQWDSATSKWVNKPAANQTISFTPNNAGDVVGASSGTNSLTPTLTIGAGKVTNTMLAGGIDLASKVTGTLPMANMPKTLTGVTSVNGLTLTALPSGFSIGGGTTAKTLTVTDDATVSGTNTGDQNASQVPVSAIPGITGTTVQSVLGELGGKIAANTSAIATKLTANAPITGATKTKITYDSNGLVTAGADATTADIASSTDRRYVTDAQLAVISQTTGVNTGDQTAATVTVAPGDGVSASNVQGALKELAGRITTATAGGMTTVYHDGTLTGDGNTAASPLAVADKAVTLSKMADIANGTVLGRSSAGSGSPEALTIGTGLKVASGSLSANVALTNLTDVTVTSAATNDILQWNGNKWVNSTALSNKVDKTAIGQASGVAPLDASGKIETQYLPSSLVGAVNYKGTFDPTSGSLASPSTGNKGEYYVISKAGTYNTVAYGVGDWIISDGTTWGKVSNTNGVTTVFGRSGVVTASAGDYNTDLVTEGATNKYYTDARVSANSTVQGKEDKSNKVTSLSGTLTADNYPTANAVKSYVDNKVPATGTTGQILTVGSGGAPVWQTPTAGGTVTNVSLTANSGITGSVATSTTTPAITLSLGNITPTSVTTGSLTASSITVGPGGTVSAPNLSGSNTGDQNVQLTGDVTGTGTVGSTITVPTTIGNNAVTSAKILDGTIATADLANKAVTQAKLNVPAAGSTGQVLTSDGAGGFAWGASGGGATNLTYTPSATNGQIASSTGTGATLPVASSTAAGLLSASDKVKLDGIAANANDYTLPTASASVLGGVKVGSGLSIAADGTLSSTASGSAPSISNNTLLGNNSGATAAATELAPAAVKTMLGLNNVENTALSTWTGSTSISSVGTINSGSWNGTTIPIAKGGTGATTATAALNALLPSQTGNAGMVLQTNGTNASWAAAGNSPIAAGTLLGNNTASTAAPTALTASAVKTMLSLTKSDVGLGNVQNVDQTNAVNLTSGTIPAARYGSSTIPVSALAASGTPSTSTYLRGDGFWATMSSGSGDMMKSTYDNAGINQQVVGISATQTLTNKTLTSPIITSPTGIVKADVGLGNVDNTSDLNKPISTATQTALNGKQDVANISNNITTDAASTTKYPSVSAIKTYVDNKMPAITATDANKVLTVNGTGTAATWQAPAAGGGSSGPTYQVYAPGGNSKFFVKATGPGVTIALTGNNVTIVIPDGVTVSMIKIFSSYQELGNNTQLNFSITDKSTTAPVNTSVTDMVPPVMQLGDINSLSPFIHTQQNMGMAALQYYVTGVGNGTINFYLTGLSSHNQPQGFYVMLRY